MLERIDPKQFDVSLLVLAPGGPLTGSIPHHVEVVPTPPVLTAATLPRSRAWWALWELARFFSVRKRRLLTALAALATVVAAAITRTPGQQLRQRLWRRVGPHLPQVSGHFDAAVGILGVSTYAVIDLVDADHKYHWLRSDTRVLQRDERIEAEYFARLTGVISVSAICTEIFVDVYPSFRDRIREYKNDIPQLPSTAPAEWPAKASDTLRILTVARLDKLKGLDLAIEAAEELRRRGRAFSWLVAGDGPERSRLTERIRDLALEEHVMLAGTVLNTQPLLAMADLYVHPSRAEGRSNAVEEAKAAGVAVITTRYPTVGEQVTDGVDGIVCDFSVSAIADAIDDLADDPARRARIAATAKHVYESERDDPHRLLSDLANGRWP